MRVWFSFHLSSYVINPEGKKSGLMHSRHSDNFAEQANEPQMHFLAPLRTVEQRRESVLGGGRRGSTCVCLWSGGKLFPGAGGIAKNITVD